ncbi:hypothetical protein [Rhizobium mongolense]|uniref:Uncharacterized protein n=1 Tax=Rhizobium mongolense TaxID=57676 RepID=A0ABR6IZF7_9HYPH|nr:hypothetical protein [Rhizobium mongolense]MBB4233294.1 hypothetical protein [Rhizobium mongolense]
MPSGDDRIIEAKCVPNWRTVCAAPILDTGGLVVMALGNGADGHAFLAAKRVMRVRNLTAAAKMSGSVQPAILGTLEAFQA